MLGYLSNSFTPDAASNLIELKRGIYGDSRFYGAESIFEDRRPFIYMSLLFDTRYMWLILKIRPIRDRG